MQWFSFATAFAQLNKFSEAVLMSMPTMEMIDSFVP
jgi:hypothetical protein